MPALWGLGRAWGGVKLAGSGNIKQKQDFAAMGVAAIAVASGGL